MFKLVICALFVVAAAEPEPSSFIGLPGYISPYSTYVAPVTTTITKQASSVLHPSPYFIPAPVAFPHFIKKRSAVLPLGYYPPTTYLASAPFATTYSAPLIPHAPILSAPALPYIGAPHLIKKRSAPLLPISTYIAPTTYSYAATSPLLASPYAASAPFYASAPLISSPYTHFIKK